MIAIYFGPSISKACQCQNILHPMETLEDSMPSINFNSNFTLTYPKPAAAAIVENHEYPEKLIPSFAWRIQIFAGYNVLPLGYTYYDESQAVQCTGIWCSIST